MTCNDLGRARFFLDVPFENEKTILNQDDISEVTRPGEGRGGGGGAPPPPPLLPLSSVLIPGRTMTPLFA